MISWITRSLRSLRETLEFGDTPRQLAMGIALGLVIGLVPKGNLLCVGLCLIGLSTRVNLGATMISAILFSMVSPLADPLTHRIGLSMLTWELLQPIYGGLYKIPFFPWTGFNNTVVLGALTLGVLLFLPTYWISHRILERTKPADYQRKVLAPTTARSYMATGKPVRIDDRETFQPTIAMAEPANVESLAAEQAEYEAAAQRRVETSHGAAPIAPAHFGTTTDTTSATH